MHAASYILPVTIAQAYGSGTYDTSTYNGQTSTGTSTSGSSGGSLVDTGTVVIAFVTLACLIIIVAIVVRIMKRKKPPVSPSVTGTAETIDGEHRKI
jgi:hypothetical protein